MREAIGQFQEFVHLQDGAAFLQLKVDDSEVVEWLHQLGDSDERVKIVKRAFLTKTKFS
ncbi:MAG: hypothetical protein NZ805_01010 [Armatimonadetes bacterium]|nr:hypothetical protein [Armatimonadota bacterium]MDW8027627.1 hypothetical protein [Armatimonadota bacterium]